jgi:hypothetical protein
MSAPQAGKWQTYIGVFSTPEAVTDKISDVPDKVDGFRMVH